MSFNNQKNVSLNRKNLFLNEVIIILSWVTKIEKDTYIKRSLMKIGRKNYTLNIVMITSASSLPRLLTSSLIMIFGESKLFYDHNI